MDIADLIDTQVLRDVSSPQLFYSEPSSTSEDYDALFHSYEDAALGSISEQELIESLHFHLDNPSDQTMSVSGFESEPQVFRLPNLDIPDSDLNTPILPKAAPESAHARVEIEILKDQVEQLSSENEQLKATLRELDSGHPLHASHSYLNAIEELEMLRRLTGIQTKQLNELQRHNESLN